MPLRLFKQADINMDMDISHLSVDDVISVNSWDTGKLENVFGKW